MKKHYKIVHPGLRLAGCAIAPAAPPQSDTPTAAPPQSDTPTAAPPQSDTPTAAPPQSDTPTAAPTTAAKQLFQGIQYTMRTPEQLAEQLKWPLVGETLSQIKDGHKTIKEFLGNLVQEYEQQSRRDLSVFL